ncbi:energy transducer TonB [Roseivirga echinicomitans]|nr:hypothetical protein [Roseivirga echinicomitans]
MKFIWLCSFCLLSLTLNAKVNIHSSSLEGGFGNGNLNEHSNSDSLIFKYGKQAYLKKIWSLQYPREATMAEKQGTMIFKITITPEGSMKATLLTDLGTEINEAVTALIGSLGDQFLVQPEEYSIYQTIFFSLHHSYQDAFKSSVEGFKTDYDGMWLEPSRAEVMMRVRSVSGTVSGVSVRTSGQVSSAQAQAMISAAEASANRTTYNEPKMPLEGYQLKSYNLKMKQYEKYVAKGKTKKAYGAVSELILFNPFDIKLIQARRRMEKELGVDTYRSFDIPLTVALSEVK